MVIVATSLRLRCLSHCARCVCVYVCVCMRGVREEVFRMNKRDDGFTPTIGIVIGSEFVRQAIARSLVATLLSFLSLWVQVVLGCEFIGVNASHAPCSFHVMRSVN